MSTGVEAILLAVPCAYCGAEVGDLCYRPSGRPHRSGHSPRFYRATSAGLLPLPEQIRGIHPFHFRSGEWASVVTVIYDEEHDRPAYLVEFPDGETDHWPCVDPDAGYEFRRVADTPAPSPGDADTQPEETP